MEKSQQVWNLNTTVWKWELEGYGADKMSEDSFVEDLIILAVIVGVIIILLFLLAVQISRSFFKTTGDKSTNASSFSSMSPSLFDEKSPKYSDVILDVEFSRQDDTPRSINRFI